MFHFKRTRRLISADKNDALAFTEADLAEIEAYANRSAVLSV